MTLADKKVLVYYSDQLADSSHASVESLFFHELNASFHVVVVYYDRQAPQTIWLQPRKLLIPYRKRSVWMDEVGRMLPLATIDFIIVRNIFAVYKNALKHRRQHAFKVLFHYSFPHTYRHYYAEQGFGFARLRKFIKYRWHHFLQIRLLRQANGFLPISERMPAMLGMPANVPVFPIHSGVDFKQMPPLDKKGSQSESGVVRFLYVGTLDPLRRMDVVLQGFEQLERDDWRLDLITSQGSYAQQLVEGIMVRHAALVRVLPALPRHRLYQEMTHYHVALCLIPPTSLYQVSSPLKLMEYYAVALPVVMSRLPECLHLFGQAGCGWFAEFDALGIRRALEAALDTPPALRVQMGKIGADIVLAERNYAVIAVRFAEFLRQLA